MKEIYIDILEKVVEAYTPEHIERYTNEVIERGLEEHGYPRLTANIGILIAHGRKQELREDFLKMMNLCLKEMPTARSRNGRRVGNDFSVKEIVFCLLETEKAGSFPKEITDGWREELAKINPYLTYSQIAAYPPNNMANWAAFGAFSEQMRKYAGIADESFFIENQLASQMHAFDENGMYRDPGSPMVYDFVTRLQIAGALHFGFEGENKDNLLQMFLKSADKTLYMQSVTGEIPFGGRSNQFLHNETFYAALCEFYAALFKKHGDMKKAGQFKSAARKATEYILPWLDENPVPHIKNYYPMNSMYGCEEYAYYDKYMITAASWLYMAYAFSDDTIKEIPCPSECKNYICETTDDFHMTFLKYGDYFVQIDTAANPNYDASGIGRVHRRGAPPTICLSMPFSAHPNYTIDIENPTPLSVCAGDGNTDYEITSKEVTDDFVKIEYTSQNESGLTVKQTCIVSENGVEFKAEGDGKVEISFPMFYFDGENETKRSVSGNCAEVEYKGWKCIYTADGEITEGGIYANRNGHYIRMNVKGKDLVTLKIEIKEIEL